MYTVETIISGLYNKLSLKVFFIIDLTNILNEIRVLQGAELIK